ncbi:hypothetical protein HRH25_06570 [Flavisolibacter sp. BT320]|nr:hypothetical protein [Flavisolibacter longurius]
MQLSISKKTTVKEVKDQFSTLFPFLKLAFFLQKHDEGEHSDPALQLSDNAILSGQLQTLTEGDFHFSPELSVGAFEQRLQQEHGLPVQVFRRSGKVWLETVQTDHLSLTQQNEKGKEASLPVRFNRYTLFL